MATKKINRNKRANTKSVAKNINEFVLDTTKMIVDETIDRAAAWQGVSEKAINGGFKLMNTQTDLMFKTFETLKRQWVKGQEKFAERISK